MKTLLIVLLCPVLGFGAPSDSILTFQQAKARLVQKNLSLLAAYYDIDVAEAQLLQARLWNNPYFIWNQELYNAEKNEYLNYRNQYMIQIEQVFSIAGKHTNAVKLARIGVEISHVQFQDVMRSLLYDLGVTYNDLAALQAKGELFNSVMSSYDRLMAATREQLRVGAISISEALRLESEYKAVKAQALENANQREKALAQLRISLQYPADTVVLVEQNIPPFSPSLQMDTLILKAIDLRPDLKVNDLYRKYQERNIRLQQSSGIPDVKIGFQPIDLASNYIRNYSGLNLEFPLPIFDRNQGRIQQAKVNLIQSEYDLKLKTSMVKNEVVASLKRYQQTNEGIITYTPEFLQKIKTLNNNVNADFERRTISLLEFIDQQRIYIMTNLQLIDLRQQYLDSVNDLNFSVGTQVIEN